MTEEDVKGIDGTGNGTPQVGVGSTPEPQDGEETTLVLAEIQESDTFRMRGLEDEATVERYAELFTDYMDEKRNGKKAKYPFPAIWVWFVNGVYILLAGFHRLAAARRAGLDEILVRICTGTEDEAFKIAMKDNSKHGRAMNDDDVKYAIKKAFIRFPDKSLRWMVKEVGGSLGTVHKIKNEMIQNGELQGVEKLVGLDGKEHTARRSRRDNQSNDDGSGGSGSKPKLDPLMKALEQTKKLSLAERKRYAYVFVENLVDDVPDKEGIDFLEEYIRRCEYMHNYRAGITKSNDASQATDQSAQTA